MNEQEWMTATDPTPMLEFLRNSDQSCDRQLRLFAAACCRRAWRLLDAKGRAAVEMSERFADGLVSQEELMAAVWANLGCQSVDVRAAVDYAVVGGWLPAVALLAAVCADPPDAVPSCPADPADLAQEQAAQADLLRDVIGNPFRSPPTIDSTALIVKMLAQSAYDDRLLPSGHLDAVRLAVLCDALLDCGCPADHELLLHLREGKGPHVRGCFAVDAVLGRKDAI